MGAIGSTNPFGRPTQMVDKLIGDAYPVVKTVYDHMEFIHLVAANLQQSTVGVPLLVQRGVLLHGSVTTSGPTEIEFTDMDLNYLNILSCSVRLQSLDNKLYFSDSGYFTYSVTSTGIELELTDNAPSSLEEAIVQCFIVYGADG